MVENIRGTTVLKFFRNFIEITLQHGCSPVNLLHVFKTPFVKNKLRTVASEERWSGHFESFFSNVNVIFFFKCEPYQCKRYLCSTWKYLLWFDCFVDVCCYSFCIFSNVCIHSDAYDLVLFSLLLFRSWHVYLGISRNFFKHRKHGALSFLRYIFTRPEISA